MVRRVATWGVCTGMMADSLPTTATLLARPDARTIFRFTVFFFIFALHAHFPLSRLASTPHAPIADAINSHGCPCYSGAGLSILELNAITTRLIIIARPSYAQGHEHLESP